MLAEVEKHPGDVSHNWAAAHVHEICAPPATSTTFTKMLETSSMPAFVIVNGIPNADPPKAMSAAHPVTKKALLVKIDPPPSWFIELWTYIGKDWAKDAALTLSLFTLQFRLVMGCTKQRPETIQ